MNIELKTHVERMEQQIHQSENIRIQITEEKRKCEHELEKTKGVYIT